MPIVIRRNGISKNHYRQRRRGLSPSRTPETIPEYREQQRRGFARNPRKGQQNRRQYSAIRGRDDYRCNRLPLARPQGHGTFAQCSWYRAQKLLGAPQGYGNHHQPQGKAASQRREMPEGQYHQAIGKYPDNDRRHAVQQIGGVAHHQSDRAPAEFRQVNSAEKSERNAQQTAWKKQFG